MISRRDIVLWPAAFLLATTISTSAEPGNGKGNGKGGGEGNAGGNGNGNGSGGQQGNSAGKSKGKIGAFPEQDAPEVTADPATSGIRLRHRNGFEEIWGEGRYHLKDNKGRTIVNRRATAKDRLRLRTLTRLLGGTSL
jgi:hypothetical protein